MQRIMNDGELQHALRARFSIIFQHSTQCAISANAYREMEAFLKVHADAPVYVVDVLEQRSLSQEIAAATGVRHESPQVIVLQHGMPVWHASHHHITAPDLENALVDFQ